MPPTQPTGMPAPCPCGFCTVALQQLRDGTWGTGRGDWADLWAALSPVVAHHTLAHAPTDHSVRYTRDRQSMMQTVHINPPGTPASESNLLPIVRGVNLIPCDPDTCCGRCCTIAPDDLADLAAWDKRDDADE